MKNRWQKIKKSWKKLFSKKYITTFIVKENSFRILEFKKTKKGLLPVYEKTGNFDKEIFLIEENIFRKDNFLKFFKKTKKDLGSDLIIFNKIENKKLENSLKDCFTFSGFSNVFSFDLEKSLNFIFSEKDKEKYFTYFKTQNSGIFFNNNKNKILDFKNLDDLENFLKNKNFQSDDICFSGNIEDVDFIKTFFKKYFFHVEPLNVWQNLFSFDKFIPENILFEDSFFYTENIAFALKFFNEKGRKFEKKENTPESKNKKNISKDLKLKKNKKNTEKTISEKNTEKTISEKDFSQKKTNYSSLDFSKLTSFSNSSEK